MQFDWLTFILQIVNVLVLLAILRHFLFRPVADIIAKRQAEIVAAKDAADAAQAQAAKAEADAHAETEKTALARNDVLASAQSDAEKQQAKMVEAARAKAAKIVDDAQVEAAKVAKGAQAQTLRRAKELAETIAQKALSDLPAPPTISGFAQRLAAELAAMTEDKRKVLLSGAHLKLVAAHALSDADVAAVKDALGAMGLGDAAIDVDPTLIAGLELRSATGTVYNSVAHDLQRISEALGNGD
ncbi:ATPase [Antarctobacter sp.]|uniref:F0F1 ATP synthase subunit B family protein n=1 Tax=Antarctobacter sp. TaxID=1872577 RepID=UPI002B26D3EE|nr:ATPase [Antarctobacter sp.]